MHLLLGYLYYSIVYFALSLRYRIRVKGLKNIPEDEGLLFLANHPAEIDPCILLRVLWPRFKVAPIAAAYLFRLPVVGHLLRFLGALSVPSFDRVSNSFKRHEIEKTYEKIHAALVEGKNLLIYPAGGLKVRGEEVIAGASGVHTILQDTPEVNIVLIRSSGLWGSSFSKAFTGKTPELGRAFLHGLLTLLRNGIFFTPRREVTIECVFNPPGFPKGGKRLEINRYLESWYNAQGPEPLKLVSYSLWKRMVPDIQEREEATEINYSKAPIEIREKVVEEIAKLSRTQQEIRPELSLATDLGLDSLDLAQIGVMLKESFGVTGVSLTDLETVGHVIAYAAKLIKGKNEEEEEEVKPREKEEKRRPDAYYPTGKNLVDVFFKTAARMKGALACTDQVSGDISYRKFKFAMVLLALRLAKIPTERIGILLPASSIVNILILATLLAKKTPVMINWTLGERTLDSILKQAELQATVTSLRFLDRLENVELNGFDNQFLMLEEIKKSLSLREKLTALIYCFLGSKYIMKKLGADSINKEETAVILFTSGTENLPKGVPLSHLNIMTNHKSALKLVELNHEDTLLGVLPPFHSFGFCVTGLLPILAGIKAAYSPNPTDGRRMALAIEREKITLICMAPSFLKNLLRVATEKQLSSVRLIVVGAEKTAADIYEKLKALNPKTQLIEGYGITECSPILTLNPPSKPRPGTVGVPLSGVAIKIVDPHTLKEIALGEVGLILVTGATVFNGYLDPNLPQPFIEQEGKRWYDTGDLGFLDQQGYLVLSGRLKRFVKIGGEMISLGAVEEALTEGGKTRGWPFDPETPSLAIFPLEEEGKKTELHLFTTFPLSVEEANQILRQAGMSNLIRVRSTKQLPFIPLLGTGKIDYQKLIQKK